MSSVRVLVGTKKGAFILTADGKREKWDVSGPHFAGWEMYHVKGSPADPNRIYASQTSGWFGQIIQRSDDGGKTWHQPGTPAGEPPAPGPPKAASNKFAYDTPEKAANHLRLISGMTGPSIRGSLNGCGIWSHRCEIQTWFTRAWKTLQFSARPMAGRTGKNFPACAATAPGPSGSLARAECACTPSFSIPAIPQRIFIAISAAGAFRTDDGGKTWKPINRGLRFAIYS